MHTIVNQCLCVHHLFICLLLLLLYVSGLGYITGAYAGYMMGSWQWALRVSSVFWKFIHFRLFCLFFVFLVDVDDVIDLLFCSVQVTSVSKTHTIAKIFVTADFC